MAAITKKTAAGFAKMLDEVQVLTVEQLAALSAAASTLLQEKLESGAKPVKKAAKKAAAAVASDEEEAAPKTVSPHLAYNRMWIEHVKAYATAHGWDTPFLKKITPRGGDSYMEQKSESKLIPSLGHVYSDTQTAPAAADFMSLAKHWRDSEHGVWEAYVEENPVPVTAPKAKKVIAVKAAPAAVAVVPAKVTPKKLPVAAAAAAAATVVAVPAPVIAKPRKAAPKAVVKAAAKPAEPAWVCPPDGQGIWVMDGNQYIRDSEDLVWTMVTDADGTADRGEWCGKWDEKTKLFDKTVADPRDALAEEDDE